MQLGDIILSAVAAVVVVAAVVISSMKVSRSRAQIDALSKENNQLSDENTKLSQELDEIKQKAWIRGTKGRFERLVPKEELLPGVTSELENPVVGG